MEFTSQEMRYVDFCQGVIQVGKETAMAIDQKCEGWYTASESILAPAIQEKKNCTTAFTTEVDSALMK